MRLNFNEALVPRKGFLRLMCAVWCVAVAGTLHTVFSQVYTGKRKLESKKGWKEGLVFKLESLT